MWSPATWTWRAALTCVLLESVLHGVTGRCFCNRSWVGGTHKHANAVDMEAKPDRVLAGTDVVASALSGSAGSAGSGATLRLLLHALSIALLPVVHP